jgi:NADH:ubiquinone oxidoreductase subunit 4 (subunit M)
MFQRVAFGPVSDFLTGLGDHLTDMSQVELVTVAPLAVLIVVFGIFPSVILDFLRGPIQAFLLAAGVAVG